MRVLGLAIGLGLVGALVACNVSFGLDQVSKPVDAAPDTFVAPHLVAWLPLDTLSDSASPDLVGAAATCSTCPRIENLGKVDKAIELTAPNQFLRLQQRPALETPAGFTVSFWVRILELPLPGSASKSCAIQKAYGASSQTSWQFCVTPDGTAHFSGQDVGTVEVTQAGFALTVWHKVVLTYAPGAPGTMTLWIDGTKLPGRSANLAFDGGPITVGAQLDGAASIYGLRGYIDEVRVYDIVLGDAEIPQLP